MFATVQADPPADAPLPPGTSLRRALRRVAAGLRDAWLILGVAFLMIVGAEGAYRFQAAVRRALGGGAPIDEVQLAHQGVPWFDAYRREHDAANGLRWKPYVYFRRRAFAGEMLNVDDRGHRRTIQPAGGTQRAALFFFGGSTMFGSYQRDAMTIPSVVARRFETAGAGGTYEVTNYGETGWVFTQSVLELMQELRAGARPRVVVFYDGINDVAATVQNGDAGFPQNERNRARDFSLGRTAFTWEHGFAAEARALGGLAAAAATRSNLLERLRGLVARPADGSGLAPDSLAARLAASYVATVRMVEALADAFGFRALYVWQANLHSGPKPRTVHEQAMLDAQLADPFGRVVAAVHARMPALLDSAMGAVAPGRFLDQTRIFAADSSEVFVDQIGHVNEAAVERIVAELWPSLVHTLGEAAARQRAVTSKPR